MFISIDANEGFRPNPNAIVSSAGISICVSEPERIRAYNYGPQYLFGTIAAEMSDRDLIEAAEKAGTFRFWNTAIDDIYNDLLNE
jgi:hypothetical protein